MPTKTANQITEELRRELDSLGLPLTTRLVLNGLVIALCRALMEETAAEALKLFEAEWGKRG